jgi:predicted  nucleic acid-binding Zn-ribbon protein
MIQDTFKSQLKQIQSVNDKVLAQLKPKLDKATKEGKKALNQLGSSAIEDKSIAEIIADIREHNPTLKSLILNLDSATYDARKQLSWNTTMMGAYAKLQAEIKFEKDIKPALKAYASNVEDNINTLFAKVTELKTKVIN